MIVSYQPNAIKLKVGVVVVNYLLCPVVQSTGMEVVWEYNSALWPCLHVRTIYSYVFKKIKFFIKFCKQGSPQM